MKVDSSDRLAYWRSEKDCTGGTAPIKGHYYPIQAFECSLSKRSASEFILAPAKGAQVKAGTTLRTFEFRAPGTADRDKWMAYMQERIRDAPRHRDDEETKAPPGEDHTTGNDASRSSNARRRPRHHPSNTSQGSLHSGGGDGAGDGGGEDCASDAATPAAVVGLSASAIR